MIYLSHFAFPFYPFLILSAHQLKMLDFEPVTILYGGNGSGKTTALNVIAEKLGLVRDTLYNRSSFFGITRNCARLRLSGKFQRTAGSSQVMMCLTLCSICAVSTKE